MSTQKPGIAGVLNGRNISGLVKDRFPTLSHAAALIRDPANQKTKNDLVIDLFPAWVKGRLAVSGAQWQAKRLVSGGTAGGGLEIRGVGGGVVLEAIGCLNPPTPPTKGLKIRA